MARAAEGGQLGLERTHLRAEDELAVLEDARNRLVDRPSQTSPLRGDVDERDRCGFGAGALIHRGHELDVHRRSGPRQPISRRGPRRWSGGSRLRSALETANRDLEASNAFLAGHRRLLPVADRTDEGLQLGAQRLGVPNREVSHRIAAIRLEAEALGDLSGQQVAHDVLVAGRDGDVARLEGREPVGVDVREHPRGGAELEQRDVLALGDRVRQLRLHLGDFGLGEPADEIDVVHGKVDDHAHVGHAGREWPDAGDGDRQNVLAANGLLDRFDRRIEALDVADHQGNARVARRRDDRPSLLHRRGDRLLDQDMHPMLDAGERQIPVQVRGRGDGDRVDAGGQHSLDVVAGRATEHSGNEFALLAIGIGDGDELDARKISEHARMVAAHHADADHAHAQRSFRAVLRGLHHDEVVPSANVPP